MLTTNAGYKHTTFFQSHTGTEPSLDIPLVCSMDPQPTSPKAQEISPHMSLLNRLSSTFIESLLASAAKFRSEDNDSAPNPACFDPQDVELLEHLVGEISRIGFKLLYYSVPGLPPASSNQIGVLRSRLDAVRQILEGQPDT